jgi:hypothetical protein
LRQRDCGQRIAFRRQIERTGRANAGIPERDGFLRDIVQRIDVPWRNGGGGGGHRTRENRAQHGKDSARDGHGRDISPAGLLQGAQRASKVIDLRCDARRRRLIRKAT